MQNVDASPRPAPGLYSWDPKGSLVVFDECHKAKNLINDAGLPTKTAGVRPAHPLTPLSPLVVKNKFKCRRLSTRHRFRGYGPLTTTFTYCYWYTTLTSSVSKCGASSSPPTSEPCTDHHVRCVYYTSSIERLIEEVEAKIKKTNERGVSRRLCETALAVVALQEALPEARVMYCSATVGGDGGAG